MSLLSEAAMKNLAIVFCLGLLALPAARAQETFQQPQPPADDAQETPPAAPSTDEKIQELDQKIRVLERKIEIDKEAAEEKARSAAQAVAGKDGFSLRSADGSFVLRLRGYAQFDGRFWVDDEKKPQVETFLLRRVRPIFEGTVYKIFDFRVMPDFGQGQTVLFDAYLEARFNPAFRVRAGKLKPPVGLERLQSATDILFVERALPTNLVPNRDLGVQVGGDLAGGAVSYAVGVFNGVPDLGNGDTDSNDDKDVAARLFFQPFVAGNGPLKGLGFGVGASQGKQTGTPAATGLPGYRTPGQQTFFSYRSDGTGAGTVVADGTRFRLAPQGYFYRGPFGLLVEHTTSRQEVRRDLAAERLEHKAWQAAASWVVAGGEASFRGVNVKKVWDPAAHTYGAFELAARYSELKLDDATFPTFASLTGSARSAKAWAVGLNWCFNRNLRLLFDYEDTKFEGGAATGDREDEKIFFSRFQIAF
jgi:phosphate-selective porin OprO/OprP